MASVAESKSGRCDGVENKETAGDDDGSVTSLFHATDRYAAELSLRSQRFEPSTGGLLGPGVYFWESAEVAQEWCEESGVVLEARVRLGPCHHITGDRTAAVIRDALRRCECDACGEDGKGLHGVGPRHLVPLHDGAWEQLSFAQQCFALETCPTVAADTDGGAWGPSESEFLAWQGEGFAAARYTHKPGIKDCYDDPHCLDCRSWQCQCGAQRYPVVDAHPRSTEVCVADLGCIGRISLLQTEVVGISDLDRCAWWDMEPAARDVELLTFRKPELDILGEADKALEDGSVEAVRAALERLEEVTGPEYVGKSGRASQLAEAACTLERERREALQKEGEELLQKELAQFSAALAATRDTKQAAAEQRIAVASEAIAAASGGDGDKKAAGRELGAAKTAALHLAREIQKADEALRRRDVDAVRAALERCECLET